MKKMTADEAYTKHIEMWTAMQKELGDNPTYSNREDFKIAWVRKHGETVLNSCYLCQYNLETGSTHCGNNCIVNWGGGCLLGKTPYDTSPISEILALPRKEENDGRFN